MTNERENLIQCTYCGEMFDPEEENMVMTEDGMVCEDCCDKYYFWCEECREYVDENHIVVVNRDTRNKRYICNVCADRNYYQCCECGDYFTDDRVEETSTAGDYICDDCLENSNYWHYCPGCGYIVPDREWNFNHDCCEDCAPDDAELYDYSYKPTPIFFGDDKEDSVPFLGVELEIDDGDVGEFAESVEGIEEIYCKEDGSLSGDGVEIVSHPCTLDYHRKLWDDIIDNATNAGFTSHDAKTCGLHVHLNRDCFGNNEAEQDLHIAKMILIVNRFWESHLLRFSRRTSSQINQWASVEEDLSITKNDTVEAVADKMRDKKEKEGRYRAVNLQNEHTVELRFFRGTLRKESFYASLELAQALAKLAKKTALKDIDTLTWQDIIDTADSENFVSYCKYRGLKAEDKGKNVLATVNNHHDWKIKEGDIVRVSPEANLALDWIPGADFQRKIVAHHFKVVGVYGNRVHFRTKMGLNDAEMGLNDAEMGLNDAEFWVSLGNIDRVFPC